VVRLIDDGLRRGKFSGDSSAIDVSGSDDVVIAFLICLNADARCG
jgi:hypothetical protein